MRIVAGEFGGRRLQVPKNRDIRPTSDKVRGAIFNALMSKGEIEGACVLDLFCGTGALGLEAMSRGASRCTFIDKARESLGLAKANAQDLGVQADFLLKDAAKISGLEAFSLVFLDPPYEQELVIPVLNNLDEQQLLETEAVLVVETEKGFSWPGHSSYELLDERLYGDTKIFYLAYKGLSPK